MKLSLLKTFFISVIVLTSGISLIAQNRQYAINEDKSIVSLLVNQNKTKLTLADMQFKKRGAPLLEAKLYSLDMIMDTVGVWSELPSKDNIWKLKINVPQAKGFFVSFDDFFIPKGARLFVYNNNNPNKAVVYTDTANPNGGPYSLENLQGDNVVLEYVTSAGISEKPRLHLFNVGYKYQDDHGENMSGFNHEANKCMININCPQGEEWLDQKRGVLRLRVNKTGSTGLCSGTLINNTNNDKTPYVLTAYHCFENMTEEQMKNTEFFFEYETPSCENTITQPSYKYHKGAEVLVLNPIQGASDGVLLKLTEPIPNNWNVYFNGWDRRNNANEIIGGSVIHHPRGDVKKITLYDKSPYSDQWSTASPSGTHWVVSYSNGVTEEGSSGSPLFNQDKCVIGTLTGGDSSCSNPTKTDYYGKVWAHWDQSSDIAKRMNRYLDPQNTGDLRIAGINNNDDADKTLTVYKSVFTLKPNGTDETKIISGNGDYRISLPNDKVAKVALNGQNISIAALGYGSVRVKVTDSRNKEAYLNIFVHQDIEISVDGNKSLKVASFREGDMIKEVRIIDLDGDVFYDKKNLNEESHIVDMNFLRRALYIIQVKTSRGNSMSEKILW